MTEELKPCPFCGGTNLEVHGYEIHYVVCIECGTEGPYPADKGQSEEEAIEAWNRRTNA